MTRLSPILIVLCASITVGCRAKKDNAEQVRAKSEYEHAQGQVENDRLAVRNEELKVEIDMAQHRKNNGLDLMKANSKLQADESLLRIMQMPGPTD